MLGVGLLAWRGEKLELTEIDGAWACLSFCYADELALRGPGDRLKAGLQPGPSPAGLESRLQADPSPDHGGMPLAWSTETG